MMLKKICVLSIATVITISMSETGVAANRYALIIGVKTYRPGQPLPQLSYTENDADGLAEVLKTGGYDVTLMTQTVAREKGNEVYNPLSDYIRDQLKAILDNPFLKEDDVVLVALAGHGVQYELTDEEGRKIPKFYFCPADANVSQLKVANEITDRNRLIDLGELYTALKNCKAGGKLLLVDACRNDPTKPGIARTLASSTLPQLPPPPGGTAAFFSCSAHQQAFEDSDLQHGVFFHHVIQAFRGDADSSTKTRAADGQITLSELSEHVSASTYDLVRKKFQGARQAPELKGEFRLTLPLIKIVFEEKTDVTNSVGMTMKLIPDGSFMMGSEFEDLFPGEQPVHHVQLTRPFYLQSTEVTQQQWKSVMGTEPWKGEKGVKEGDTYAVTYVSHEDAVEFCEKLSRKEGKIYRLPTEAEWEYACRAGSKTEYSFGDDDSQLSDYAWFDQYVDGYTHRVGQKRPNAFGLFDMHGNVEEWCSDWYRGEYYRVSPEIDPKGPPFGPLRAVRGGSWRSGEYYIRSASRGSKGGRYRAVDIGFRVVLE